MLKNGFICKLIKSITMSDAREILLADVPVSTLYQNNQVRASQLEKPKQVFTNCEKMIYND